MNINEAINYTTNRLVQANLLKNGKVTLEEAIFLEKLSTEIITEAMNEFGQEIPEENLTPVELTPEELQEPASEEVEETPESEKVLTDEQGNEFIYNPVTGELDPVDTPEPEVYKNDEQEEIPDSENDVPVDGIVPELGEGLMESEIIARKLLSL